MCKAVEDYGNTLIAERNVEVAEALLRQNILPIDKISEATGLSEKEVIKISETLSQCQN